MPLNSKKVRAQQLEFIDNLKVALNGFATSAAGDPVQVAVFKHCIAGSIVLTELQGRAECDELICAANGLSKRIANLCAIRQYSLARVELRRLIECAIWFVYFTDHPVEWASFKANPTRGYEERSKEPILSAASALPAVFFAYCSERFKGPACQVGIEANGRLKSDYSKLSGEVHAAMGAIHPSGSLALAADHHDVAKVNILSDEVRRVIADCVLLFLTCTPKFVARVSTSEVSDWTKHLIGDANFAKIGMADFGVVRSP